MIRLALILAALPMPALAHPGNHVWGDLAHLLSEPDHAAMLILAALAVGYGAFKLWSRR
jgi:hypothetical protein